MVEKSFFVNLDLKQLGRLAVGQRVNRVVGGQRCRNATVINSFEDCRKVLILLNCSAQCCVFFITLLNSFASCWTVMMNCRKQFKCFAVCLIVMINCRKKCYCWIVYVKLSKKKWLSNSFEVLFWLIVESFCSIVEKSKLCRKQLHIVHNQSEKGLHAQFSDA